MKAVEFQTTIRPDNSLQIPKDVAARIPRDTPVQVIVVCPDSSEELEWQRITQEQIFSGYSDGDSVHDKL